MPSRVLEWLTVLADPDATLRGAHPADEALLSLLVHAALADGDVGPGQLARLRRLMPGSSDDQIVARVSEEARHALSFDGLLMAVPEEADRQRLERLATAMTLSDDHVGSAENSFLRQLSEAIR